MKQARTRSLRIRYVTSLACISLLLGTVQPCHAAPGNFLQRIATSFTNFIKDHPRVFARMANVTTGALWAGTVVTLNHLSNKSTSEMPLATFTGVCAITIPTVLAVNFYIQNYFNLFFRSAVQERISQTNDSSQKFRICTQHALVASSNRFYLIAFLGGLAYMRGLNDKCTHANLAFAIPRLVAL